MTPRQAEIRAAYERLGSKGAVARELGIHRSTVQEALRGTDSRIDLLDPEIRKRLEQKGYLDDIKGLHSGWIIDKNKDGAGESLYFYLGKDEQEAIPLEERLAEALANIPRPDPVQPPEKHDADLLTIYPIADAHMGLMAWGKETGEDYDTNIAAERVRNWIARAVDASPASGVAVILDVGDLTHADDDSNMTPRSKHVLSVDTRHFRTLDVTIAALAGAVDYALLKHERVEVYILPGNHNQTSYMAVMFALSERYRNEPRVTVHKKPGEFFVMQFGNCMLAAHHGHGAKPDRMVHFLADEFASIWGATRHRFLWTGHLHHHKSADIGGVTWEQLRAVTARDAYAVGHAYVARAQLQAITLHRTDGEVSRVKISSSFRSAA
jgi:hypothetical protein